MVRVALALLLVAAAASLLPSTADAANYTVGDEKGWNPDVDYTAWVKKHKPFYKGDWLSKIPFLLPLSCNSVQFGADDNRWMQCSLRVPERAI